MAKTSVTFDVVVESALHLGQAPMGVGEYLFTQRCVPGTALRGALAEALINSGLDTQGETFKRLFVGLQALRFEPAYPVDQRADWEYPFPLTARCCKFHGGFPPPLTEREQYHGAFDILFSQVVFEEQLAALGCKDKPLPLPFIEMPHCPHCWEGVEPASGTYGWDDLDEQPVAAPRTDLVRHTHTAINRARGVAEDGMLYTIETLEPGTRLRGCLWVEESEVEMVRPALQNVKRLGRGVRRGHGRVSVTLKGPLESGATQKRIKKLTDLIQTERAFYDQMTGRQLLPEEGYDFTLDLLSPAVFGDGVITALAPDMADLPEGVTSVRRFVASEMVGGWWQAAGLPHPTSLAVAAGSVFLYHAPAGTDLEALALKLDSLRADGIGQLRERGYGAVMPCAPFHLWTAEKETQRQ